MCSQVHKRGTYQGEEPTVGLDYEGRVFQMFRAEDKCVAAPCSVVCAKVSSIARGIACW